VVKIDKIVFTDPVLGQAFIEGIPRGSLIIFSGVPGIGKSVFIYNIVAEMLRRDEKVIYVLFDDDPSYLLSQLKVLDIDVNDAVEKDKLILVDIFTTPILDIKPRIKLATSLNTVDPVECLQVIHRIIKEKNVDGKGVMIIDSLNEIVLRYQPGIVLDFIKGVKRIVRAYNLTCVATLHTGIPGLEQVYAAMEYVSDGFVEFSFDPQLEDMGIPLRRLRVKKLKGAAHSLQWIPYTILRGGKIAVVDVRSIVESIRTTMSKLKELAISGKST